MKSFDTFAAASAFAKELAASHGTSAAVIRSDEQWVVHLSDSGDGTLPSPRIESTGDQPDQPYQFPISQKQWRELESIREMSRLIDSKAPPFRLHHAVSRLDPIDRLTVQKFGEFLIALRQGKILPANEEQEHFVATFKNGGKTRDGVERSWLKFLREVEYSEALYFSGKDEAQYRSRLRAIARKGHKEAIELLKSLGSWDPNPPPDKGHRPDIKPIDYSKLGGRLMPGSYGSGGS
ncbi:DUF413 domain-containing protein [Pseudoxanthomonas mexicana]